MNASGSATNLKQDKGKSKVGPDGRKRNVSLGKNMAKEEMLPHEVANKDLKDPNCEVRPDEWYQWYCDIHNKLEKVNDENKKIEEDINNRAKRYIMREKDYRV